MANKYKEFSSLNLPDIEKEMLEVWQSGQAFEKSISLREGAKTFVFYEGPPSANGMPGIHHVISRTIKDMICRYKTMKGFQVQRKGGWDTHGLPVELGVEKELGITKEDIGTGKKDKSGNEVTVEYYNQKCREAVLRYKDKWDLLTTKMGYWVDLKNPYITFENNYIESLWWLLKKLYDKGLLYESISIQPYSPAAGTGLSSHELNQPGTYKDVKDTSATVVFNVVKNEKSQFLFDKTNGEELGLMAWTTTPWTLPSNLGLTVGAGIDYLLVQTKNPYTEIDQNVVIAKALFHKYFENPLNLSLEEGDAEIFENSDGKKKHFGWKILKTFKGKDLEGVSYHQLMPYEANQTDNPNAFKVLLGDFVTTEDGTGIVHTAPAFGADDYKVGQKSGIGILVMVDKEGKFIDGLGEFSGRYVKNYKDDPNYEDVNVDICVKLKKENKAFKVEKYEHSYPHCWRTDKPILYYPLDAWFIKTTALKDRMVELNKTINWKPKSTGEGRFGNWLENMVDWNLSRSRFWGTPLPVWRTEDKSEEICIGSVEELEKELQKSFNAGVSQVPPSEGFREALDLHKPYVDDITLVSPSGKPMKRVSELVDVWFDSGAMPFAQWHFPFENKEVFADNYPADFICEGVDQTRGWFYTLHAISSLVKEDVIDELKNANLPTENVDGRAYKTVVSNGLVLDKYGNKMSKRLGNTIDPFDTIDTYSADATRWYLMTNASPWDNLKFDLDGIKEVQRKFFGTLYNTYQFFALYANVDGFSFSEAYTPVNERPEIDRWILSSLHSLIKNVTENLDNYEPTLAFRAVEEFLDEHLSNWYVRLCRRRFWKGEYEADKIAAYQTLYECLETLTKLIAPLSPFFSDEIFRNLNAVAKRFEVESVHHSDFPMADESLIDLSLEERMQLAQDTSSLILSLRKKENIIVRQPLQKVLIPVLNPEMQAQFEKVEDLIKSETNIKEVEYITDAHGIIHKKIKADFKALGKRLGGKMKKAAELINNFSQDDIAALEKDGFFKIDIDEEIIEITPADVIITAEDVPGWSVAGKGNLTVALDITISEELKQEGIARMFVNRVQNIRKEYKFELTDRIFVKVAENEKVRAAIEKFSNYICSEVLADELQFVPNLQDGTEIDIDDTTLKVSVSKNS
ncbi:isoleucine--tRNA ligase [Arachidicoccus ginsenosidimutans]|uniref:isoleucine--tRNA ligase n=1 Tax=Arachidicoccus sp. BS20 TaxID=1850526 RepID=UPI0007F0AEE1|nr:isoleucine--tRNA ligase [Arachidicoccus sp. BS20]ANI89490.1 isoleucine--tRNA ligase [Arachidicoccus sp. BS20]